MESIRIVTYTKLHVYFIFEVTLSMCVDKHLGAYSCHQKASKLHQTKFANLLLNKEAVCSTNFHSQQPLHFDS